MNYSVSFYIVIIFTIKKIHLVFNSSLIPEKFMVWQKWALSQEPCHLRFEGRKTVNFVDRCCLGKFLPGILKSIGGFGKECGLVSLEQESGPI